MPKADQVATFGRLLRSYRMENGLTQESLAERAGVSVRSVQLLEAGGTRPRPYTARQLARALALPADQLAHFEAAAAPAPRQRPVPVAGEARPVAGGPLPEPPTVLIGREAQVQAAAALLRQDAPPVRLLTLTGPGGVGKTRLALAVASAVRAAYPDGVAFVDLSALRDDRLVPATVARVLGLQEAGGESARELLLRHLAGRRALLVLDNCEHLPGMAGWLAELLAACSRLAVLATSRVALRLRAERRFPVPPLAVPVAEDGLPLGEIAAVPAVRLFVERARVAASELTLDAENAAAVAGICRRLDGIPLALELAAVRVPLLSPNALLDRLERRLPLLTDGPADLPERQRTLRAALAWSHDLLGTAERALFRRLAVFADGSTLEAAEAICADGALPAAEVLGRLGALVDNSLVQRTVGADEEPRFRMLETIREYAGEQLADSGESEAVRARHRDWYVGWAERVLPELSGSDQHAWYARLAAELDNFRAARAWCQRDPGGAEAGLRLAAALARYFRVRAPGREGRRWLAQALVDGPPEPSAARARALTWCGQLDYLHGDAEAGLPRLAESVGMAQRVGDGSLLCLTLRHLAFYAADRVAAPALLEEAIAVARAAGNRSELAFALGNLGMARRRQGDDAAAAELYAEALDVARASGDLAAVMAILDWLGELETARGEYDLAQTLLDEALELSQLLEYGGFMTTINRLLAELALARGDLGAARARVRSSLEIARVSSIGAVGLRAMRLAARLAVASGEYQRAVRLFAAVAVWQGRHDVQPGSTLWADRSLPEDDDEALTGARAALGEPAFAAAWAAGWAMTLEQAVAYALDEGTGS